MAASKLDQRHELSGTEVSNIVCPRVRAHNTPLVIWMEVRSSGYSK